MQRPKVVAGYVRLTEDRDGNKIGTDIQRKAIQQWADANGYSVVFFEDEDITAAKLEVVRPRYEAMLTEIAAGSFSGVVVWRLDRLVRLTREFERGFAVIEDAGAFIQDIEQGINSATEIGKMFMRLLVMMAEMEIAAMRARARAHQQRKAEEGKVSRGGHRPFGFVGAIRDPETRKLTNPNDAFIKHVSEEATLLREAANRILKFGATHADVTRDWAKRNPPVLGTTGKPMTPDALRLILGSARIAGLREYEVVDSETGEIDVKEAVAEWTGILEVGQWRALRARRVYYKRGTTRGRRLLTGGLIKCGDCKRPMIGSSAVKYKSTESTGLYECNRSQSAKLAGSCGKCSIRAVETENHVLDLLYERFRRSPQLIDLIANAHGESEERARERAEAHEELAECNMALTDLGRRMALPKKDPMWLDPMEVVGMRAAYHLRKETADRTISRLARLAGHPVPVGDERDDIQGWFEGLGLGEQRSFLAAHLRDVFVHRPVKRSGPFFNPDRIEPIFSDSEVAGGEG